jgi:zinc protease
VRKDELNMINRKKAPLIKDPVEFDVKLPPCEKHVLTNGIEVYSINSGTEDTLMLNLVFYAGNCYEDSNTVAAATNNLLKNGTSRLSAFDLNEHFDYHGAYFNRSCYNETAEITLHCLTRHIDNLLPVLAEVVQDSNFREEEIQIYKQNSQQRLKVGLQKCDFVASRLIDANLFGEKHPYGKYSTLLDYEVLQRDQLLQFFDKYYRHGHCVIFVAGKYPEDLIKKIEQYFGKLPLRSHRDVVMGPPFPVQPSAQQKQTLINDAQGVQAAIRIARHFPNRHHPDFQKVMVLNNLFGGFFGSRLMANIREEKGYTYGIYSYLLNHVQQSGWMISTEAGRDVSEATVTEIYREMQALREEIVDEEELQVTRSYMIGSILGDLDGPFQVAARWKNLVLNNLTEEYFYKSINTIKTISATELQELANKYLQPDSFYELVVI